MRKENNNKYDLSQVVYGKIPPSAVDLEEAVLGAILIDKDAAITTMPILKPEMFYKDENKLVFEAMSELFSQSKNIDILTVTEQLRKTGNLENAGGPYAVTMLTNRVMSAAHLEEHARIVVEKYTSREIIRLSAELTSMAYDDTTLTSDLIQKAERAIFDLTSSRGKNAKKLSTIITENLKKVDHIRKNPETLIGVPTGIINLDRVTGGWQKTDLIVVAARPSMGKSAFVITVIGNAGIDFGRSVGFFSLEMNEEQVGNRILSMRSEIEQQSIKKGHISDNEMIHLVRSASAIGDPKIFVDDTAAISIFDLKAKARRMKMQHNIELLVVDYLQLMTVGGKKGQNREGEVAEISRGLKAIAKELDIPVIALSQLSRKVEERGGTKRPMLSDIRESGAIEQDADIVIFLHRPEYYGIEIDETGRSTQGQAELIIAKHRNGALENIRTNFISKYTCFKDWEDLSIPTPAVRNFYEKTAAEDDPF